MLNRVIDSIVQYCPSLPNFGPDIGRLIVAYIVYVDLSAKIEQWSRDSAVAASNGHCRVFLIRAQTKQKLRKRIRMLYGSRSERYRLLAAFVYLAVKDDLGRLAYVVIDKDYEGSQAESAIKIFLLPLLRRGDPEAYAGMIHFANVRGSKADRMAKRVYDGEAQPDRIVDFSEVADLT